MFIMWVETAERVKVRGQRWKSYVYKCVNAITAEAYILTTWRRGSLVLRMVGNGDAINVVQSV